MPRRKNQTEKLTKNVTISLPIGVLERLESESDSIGVNRSAYVSMVLNEKWKNQEVMDRVPILIDLMQKAVNLPLDAPLDLDREVIAKK